MMDHWTEVNLENLARNILKIKNTKINYEQKKVIQEISDEICDGSSRVWEKIENKL